MCLKRENVFIKAVSIFVTKSRGTCDTAVKNNVNRVVLIKCFKFLGG